MAQSDDRTGDLALAVLWILAILIYCFVQQQPKNNDESGQSKRKKKKSACDCSGCPANCNCGKCDDVNSVRSGLGSKRQRGCALGCKCSNCSLISTPRSASVRQSEKECPPNCPCAKCVGVREAKSPSIHPCPKGCQCLKCSGKPVPVRENDLDSVRYLNGCDCANCLAKKPESFCESKSKKTAVPVPCGPDCRCAVCEAKKFEVVACPADCQCDVCTKPKQQQPVDDGRCKPGCECKTCQRNKTPSIRQMLNEWVEHEIGESFPESKLVQALFRPLDTLPNENPVQYVALWYMQGEPVMGRVWNQDGKIAANFSWGGHEYTKNIGVIQILYDLPDELRGFDYDWKNFPEIAVFTTLKEWHPVRVDNHKFNIAPAVLIVDGKEILGKVDVRNEKACVGYAGAERVLVGPAVHSCKVLCRKAKPGFNFD